MNERPHARLIDAQYPNRCMTCEEPVEAGTRVWWVQNVGVWHEDCDRPRNLTVYMSEQKPR